MEATINSSAPCPRVAGIDWITPIALMLAAAIIVSALCEAYFELSLRLPLTLGVLLFAGVVALRRPMPVGAGMLVYVGALTGYLALYLTLGPGNNLIVHVYTLALGSLLVFQIMAASGKSENALWRLIEIVWLALYASLLLELIVVVAGCQHALYELFPAENFRTGLPGYRYLHNTFAHALGLDYYGLNSVLLSAQGFGQLCAMLTVFGVRFVPGQGRSMSSRRLVFVAIPVLLLMISPNMTAMLMVGGIAGANILMNNYIGTASMKRLMPAMLALAAAGLIVSFGNFDFVRTYNLLSFYDDFVAPQIAYLSRASWSDHLIGVGLEDFLRSSPVFEVSILTYASAVGTIFMAGNLLLAVGAMMRNLRQIRHLYRAGADHPKNLEMQKMNLLLIFSMLLSSSHFPVMFSFIGSALFALNMGYCLFSIRRNRLLIRALEAKV